MQIPTLISRTPIIQPAIPEKVFNRLIITRLAITIDGESKWNAQVQWDKVAPDNTSIETKILDIPDIIGSSETDPMLAQVASALLGYVIQKSIATGLIDAEVQQ